MITINGLEIPYYPDSYNDNPETIKTDDYAIDGSLERKQYPSKKRAALGYKVATPAVVQYWNNLFEAGQSVQFRNDESNKGPIEFKAVVMEVSTGDYYRGGSLLAPLAVSLREE